MKKLIALLLVGIMSVSMVACTPKTVEPAPDEETTTTPEVTEPDAETVASDFEAIEAKGKMVIGYTVYEPINYTDDEGNFVGFDTEFAQAVCDNLGVEAEFVEIEWSNKFLELQSGSIDCIWNGMTITDEAMENASVSSPYVKNAQVIIAKTENGYTSTADLVDANIIAEAGSAGEKAILADENLSQAEFMPVIKQADALLEIKSGASDAAVLDITLAGAMVGEGTDFADLSIMQGVELSVEEYGIATRKGADTNDKINEAMAELMADGTLEALAEKYGLTLAD